MILHQDIIHNTYTYQTKTRYSFCLTMDAIIIESLTQKIIEIKTQGKIPVIFILIGTYPGYSRFQQTPPIIEEYVTNPILAPIVILIDPQYRKLDWLAFLDEDYPQKQAKALAEQQEPPNPNVNPGVWYYPGLITNLGNDKKLNYCNQVAYQYYATEINRGEFHHIINHPIITDNLTLFWSFIGSNFIEDIINLNGRKMHITDSQCAADVENEIEYFPRIEEDVNGYYFKKRYESIEEILPILKAETEVKIQKRLKGFIYNIFMKWLEYHSNIHRWEIFVRFDDPSLKITVGKNSTPSEWVHLHRRAGLSSYLFTAKKNFMKTPHQYFYEYINEEIYKMGTLLIQYDCICLKDESSLEVQMASFMDEYGVMIENNSRNMPNLFVFYTKKQDYLN